MKTNTQERDAINQVLAQSEPTWSKIWHILPQFLYHCVRDIICDRITVNTDPVLFARSVEELLLYIELTGHVPADPEIFFDFGNP